MGKNVQPSLILRGRLIWGRGLGLGLDDKMFFAHLAFSAICIALMSLIKALNKEL